LGVTHLTACRVLAGGKVACGRIQSIPSPVPGQWDGRYVVELLVPVVDRLPAGASGIARDHGVARRPSFTGWRYRDSSIAAGTRILKVIRTVGAALLSGAAAGVVTAVVGAVVDMWITGHGGASLMRPWIEVGQAVALSRLDAVFLVVVSLAMIAGGRFAWQS
jgi:hypothetical protein